MPFNGCTLRLPRTCIVTDTEKGYLLSVLGSYIEIYDAHSGRKPSGKRRSRVLVFPKCGTKVDDLIKVEGTNHYIAVGGQKLSLIHEDDIKANSIVQDGYQHSFSEDIMKVLEAKIKKGSPAFIVRLLFRSGIIRQYELTFRGKTILVETVQEIKVTKNKILACSSLRKELNKKNSQFLAITTEGLEIIVRSPSNEDVPKEEFAIHYLLMTHVEFTTRFNFLACLSEKGGIIIFYCTNVSSAPDRLAQQFLLRGKSPQWLQPLATMENAHSAKPTAIATGEEKGDEYLATADEKGVIKIWKIEFEVVKGDCKLKEVKRIDSKGGPVRSLRFHLNSTSNTSQAVLYYGTESGTLVGVPLHDEFTPNPVQNFTHVVGSDGKKRPIPRMKSFGVRKGGEKWKGYLCVGEDGSLFFIDYEGTSMKEISAARTFKGVNQWTADNISTVVVYGEHEVIVYRDDPKKGAPFEQRYSTTRDIVNALPFDHFILVQVDGGEFALISFYQLDISYRFSLHNPHPLPGGDNGRDMDNSMKAVKMHMTTEVLGNILIQTMNVGFDSGDLLYSVLDDSEKRPIQSSDHIGFALRDGELNHFRLPILSPNVVDSPVVHIRDRSGDGVHVINANSIARSIYQESPCSIEVDTDLELTALRFDSMFDVVLSHDKKFYYMGLRNGHFEVDAGKDKQSVFTFPEVTKKTPFVSSFVTFGSAKTIVGMRLSAIIDGTLTVMERGAPSLTLEYVKWMHDSHVLLCKAYKADGKDRILIGSSNGKATVYEVGERGTFAMDFVFTIDSLCCGDICTDFDPPFHNVETVFFVFGTTKGKLFVGYHNYTEAKGIRQTPSFGEVAQCVNSKVVSMSLAKNLQWGDQGKVIGHRFAVAYEDGMMIDVFLASLPNTRSPTAVKLHSIMCSGATAVVCSFGQLSTLTYVEAALKNGNMLSMECHINVPFNSIGEDRNRTDEEKRIIHNLDSWKDRPMFDLIPGIEGKCKIDCRKSKFASCELTCMKSSTTKQLSNDPLRAQHKQHLVAGTVDGSVLVYRIDGTDGPFENNGNPIYIDQLKDVHKGGIVDILCPSLISMEANLFTLPRCIYTLGSDRRVCVALLYKNMLHLAFSHSICVSSPLTFSLSANRDAVIVGKGGLQVFRLCQKTIFDKATKLKESQSSRR